MIHVTARNPQWKLKITTQRNLTLTEDDLRKEILGFTVTSQIGDPASTFQIMLRPSPAPARLGRDRKWCDVISPQDFVELWAWVPPREPKFPLLRGFVDTVGEIADFSSGKPQRHDVIAGRSYGKLLLQAKLYYPLEEAPQEVVLLEKWRNGFNQVTGYGDRDLDVYPPSPEGKDALGATFTPDQFIRNLFLLFYTPYEDTVLSTFPDSSSIPVCRLHSFVDDWDEELVGFNPTFIQQNWTPFTDLWTLFRAYQHHPWRELFVREDEQQPMLVYRPTPWLNAFGNKVQPWDIDTVIVHDIPEFVSGTTLRSDEQVRNFFITEPSLTGDLAMAVKQIGPSALEALFAQPIFQSNPYLIGFKSDDRFQASAYQRYGFRLHETISPFFTMMERGWKEDDVKDALGVMRRWCREGNERLVAALGHAELLENGTRLVAGDERIRSGDYMRDRAGSYAYLPGVTHEFLVGTAPHEGRFQTRLTFTRGRRHLDRLLEGDQ